MNIALWSEIRQLHFVKGLYKKDIARRLGLSVKTVRRALKKHTPPEQIARKTVSKLDAYKERIDCLLKDYPQLSGVRILEEIRRLGYAGGKSILNDYLRSIRPSQREAFVRLETEPGEEAQVDWGLFGDYFGCGRILSCFAIVLSYSRMITLEWTLSQKMEEFLRSHQRAFQFFGGMPEKILYDNLKSVVLKRLGTEIKFNDKFLGFSGTYLFEPVACNIKRGNEKGKVERIIGYIRNNFFAGRTFTDLADLKTQSNHWRDHVANVRNHGTTRERPIDRFFKERTKLKKLPDTPFDCDQTESVKAGKDYRIKFDSNIYTVPPMFSGVWLTLKANDIYVRLYKQHRLIAEHLRSWKKYDLIEDPKHTEPLLEEKQKAINAKQKDLFLSLGQDAEKYIKGLVQTPRSLQVELKKINALVTVYGKIEVMGAINHALPYKAFGSEYLKNIILQNLSKRGEIEPVGKVEPQSRPDLIDLKVEERDLEKYHQLMENEDDE